jgi:O-antigen ligase
VLLLVALCVFSLAGLLQLRADEQAGAGLPPADDAPLAGLPFLGINIALEQSGEASQAHTLKELQAAGFGWVRQRFDWADLEPMPGRFDWTWSDAALRDIRAAGLVPIVVLDGSPAWARAPQDTGPGDNSLAPPVHSADFARFAAAFAQRYAGDVRYYQIWDEPNIAPHWGNRWIDPVHYAQLLKTVAPSIRQADADAVILLAALAPTADRGHLAVDEVYFLQRLYAAGAQPYFDAVALQPFGFGHAPHDARGQRDILNFQRARWVRQAMVAAGDVQTPILAVRYGWNRQPNPTWGAVSSQNQARFAREALDIAYTRWSWMGGMGWAAYRQDTPASDPSRGFSLNDATARALSEWQYTQPDRAAALAVHPPPPHDWPRWLLLLAATGLASWRLVAAARLLPWPRWQHAYLDLSPTLRAGVWLALGVTYYLAVWPPLILLLWLAAALLILADPHTGIRLAAALLPFYFRHKEIHWGLLHLAVPPAHAAALCLLPALMLHIRRAARPLDRWDALALGWLAVSLISAAAVWHWVAYGRGFVDLVAVPLILYWAVRTWAHTAEQRRRILMALVAGGVLAGAWGLIDWLAGGGGEADRMRRLAGVVYSPNHAALYMERTLFAALGLALYLRARRRWIWAGATLISGIALLLTGSRGALLLGLPAGLIVLVSCTRAQPARSLALRPGALVLGIAATALAALLVAAGLSWERLSNSATLVERAALWRQSWLLWLDYWLTGVGPGGFLWRFPAYISEGAPLDPNLQHPHNVWLEFAATAGLPGLIWLAAAILLTVEGVSRARRLGWPARGWAEAGLPAALAAALAHAQADAFAALADLAAWNWLALGLLAASLAQRRPPEPPSGQI